MDPLVLMAVLPGDFAYVAKKELAGKFFSRVPMERLGVEFVERFEAQRGLEDTERIIKTVSGGRSVVFFPKAPSDASRGCVRFTWGPL